MVNVNKRFLIFMVVFIGMIGIVTAANIFVNYNFQNTNVTGVNYLQAVTGNFTTVYGDGQYLTGVSTEINWATNCTGTNYFMFGTVGETHYCAQVNESAWGFVTSSYKPNIDAANITAGTGATFGTGSYVFPANLKITDDLNMTSSNVTDVDCIMFKSGGLICGTS